MRERMRKRDKERKAGERDKRAIGRERTLGEREV